MTKFTCSKIKSAEHFLMRKLQCHLFNTLPENYLSPFSWSNYQGGRSVAQETNIKPCSTSTGGSMSGKHNNSRWIHWLLANQWYVNVLRSKLTLSRCLLGIRTKHVSRLSDTGNTLSWLNTEFKWSLYRSQRCKKIISIIHLYIYLEHYRKYRLFNSSNENF